ncbi:MAG TPA: membrane protein insertase YidC [Mycobacteriales bacterium]|nr:membrane protein insertase YidC [Mycobacteriales bacterium]
MLAPLYALVSYPVSAILWFWYRLAGTVLDPGGGASWALAVVLLVLTLRVLLVPLARAQLRSGRAMAALQPQISALRTRHAGDRQAFAVALQQLQREQGVSPLGGCLPALAQIPVFLGLLHVLHGFTAGGTDYVFGAADVDSFRHARLSAAPLAAYVRMPAAQLAAYGVDRWQVAAVAIPLAALAALATYLTGRHALRRTPPADSRSALVGRLTLYVLPASALIGGVLFAFPVVILLYWLANNACTAVQQALLHRHLDRADPDGADPDRAD